MKHKCNRNKTKELWKKKSASLAKAFIKIGENIIKNNPSYIADE